MDPLNNCKNEEKLLNALKIVGLDEFFINKCNSNFETIINKGNLSSGEKQLISLARIVLNKKSILIQDESLSDVDLSLQIIIQKKNLSDF